MLALAGVLMQALLRNPLADPYVLGVSGGAAVGALGLMLVGATGLVVDVGAAVGAFGAMLLVFAVAHGAGGWTTTRLLLTGVVVAAGCGAIVSLLLSLSDDLRLRGMLFWLLGDFGYVQHALVAARPRTRRDPGLPAGGAATRCARARRTAGPPARRPGARACASRSTSPPRC